VRRLQIVPVLLSFLKVVKFPNYKIGEKVTNSLYFVAETRPDFELL
jgi:hypothetical protein